MRPMLIILLSVGLAACRPEARTERRAEVRQGAKRSYPVMKSEAEWKKILNPEQYRVARQKGTEQAFSGRYNKHRERGVYHCVACGQALFSSQDKYDSGSGWPSYTRPARSGAVQEKRDQGLGMVRTEVLCSRCGAHLGHVFDDGPAPTGLRYCINSVSLHFKKGE